MTRLGAVVLVVALAVAVGTAAVYASEPSTAGAARASVDVRDAIGEPLGAPLEGDALVAALDEITSLMRCPVCQGLSVADSPVASALAIREEVRSLLAAGYTREQIFEYFEGAYGEFIRLSPRARGFNLLVWIAPIAMVLGGVWLVWARTRRRSSEGPESSALDESLEPYRARVRREVGY